GRIIRKNEVTILWLTAALFHSMVDARLRDLATVRRLLAGGDVVSAPHARLFVESFPENWFINGYGPTEGTTFSAFHVVSGELNELSLPIGRPIAQTQIYLLDPLMNLVPQGVAGEIYIGGAGLARGYLNRPGLTAERFVPNPFGDAGTRLYRTGDLARHRGDGAIEFLGRFDHQVKIRGFRIELGEIEAHLMQENGIAAAVVLARNDPGGDKRLVAYLTPRRAPDDEGGAAETPAIDVSSLRTALGRRLPDYMIPSAFVVLDALPLTPNGKVDRKSLPSPDFEAQTTRGYVAPRNVLEWVIAREFEAVLGVDRVGIHDGFFELGGASISGLKLADRIRRTICSALPMSAIFQAQTIAELAEWIANEENRANSPLVLMRPGGEAPPLFLVHPAGGSIIRYRELAEAMPPARPIYGCQSRHLFEEADQSETLEEIASDYVACICEVQPRGPYHLLGWSMGGVTAMTMASLLERRGERVAFIGLLDTHYDDAAPVVDATAAQPDMALIYLKSFARLQSLRGSGVTPEELDARLSEGDLDHLASLSERSSRRDCFVEVALWGQERGFWSGVSAELMNFLYSEHEASMRQMQEVSLRRISAPIHVWWAQETVEESLVPLTDWSAYTDADTKVESVAGDHETIVGDSRVHGRIREALESVSDTEAERLHSSLQSPSSS
ncbi:MAG TPA: thioesterase domain-containing protein, partial [Methylocystis sp.]|nr:thioesterase domain-containing protein [Methylocystis sp.]